MQAKVKLTDAQGQEYLLMVSKVNQKGILVGHIPHLTVDQAVTLELQLGPKKEALKLHGAVHKFVEQANGSKGTIIRFTQLVDADRQELQNYMLSQKTSAEFFTSPSAPLSKSKSSNVTSQTLHTPKKALTESTIVATSQETLKHLALQSPDRDPDFITSTIDEEAIHQSDGGLAGKTIIAASGPILKMMRPKERKWLKILPLVAAVALGAAATQFFKPLKAILDKKFGSPRVVSDDNTGGASSDESSNDVSNGTPSDDTRSDTLQNATQTGSDKLTDVIVDDKSGSIKLEFQATGGLKNIQEEISNSPRRLILDLPSIATSTLENHIINVGKSPVLRLRIRDQEQYVRIYVDLYPDGSMPKFKKTITDTLLTIEFK